MGPGTGEHAGFGPGRRSILRADQNLATSLQQPEHTSGREAAPNAPRVLHWGGGAATDAKQGPARVPPGTQRLWFPAGLGSFWPPSSPRAAKQGQSSSEAVGNLVSGEPGVPTPGPQGCWWGTRVRQGPWPMGTSPQCQSCSTGAPEAAGDVQAGQREHSTLCSQHHGAAPAQPCGRVQGAPALTSPSAPQILCCL